MSKRTARPERNEFTGHKYDCPQPEWENFDGIEYEYRTPPEGCPVCGPNPVPHI